MKNYLLPLVIFFAFASLSKAQEPVNRKKMLIVYLTRTKNTKVVAEIIHNKVGGDIVPIEPINPYPADYKKTVAQVAEEDERGYLPPINLNIDNINKYDTIFVGFPTWGMQLPPPIKTFLKQYSFKGKTIVPFNTNAGYGVGTGFRQIYEICPESTILEGYTTEGGKERDGILFIMKNEKADSVAEEVNIWLNKIKILK
ncbi:flavodoxin [Chryseobacterium culicis]|uniref:Flavodoxin n=1 Tax=Chryseobacterium culicis TaxID=680127 RepID=A0A1H6IIZ8_CHRCI|nr:flavodoxin [Chryseobacterium culicis]SEH47877.1 Flavodoxin [Chryseobacterium culicis]